MKSKDFTVCDLQESLIFTIFYVPATEQDSQSSKPVTATSSASSYVLVHESLGSSSGLPSTLTVAQVMAALRHEGHPPSSHITLTLTNRRDHARGRMLSEFSIGICPQPFKNDSAALFASDEDCK